MKSGCKAASRCCISGVLGSAGDHGLNTVFGGSGGHAAKPMRFVRVVANGYDQRNFHSAREQSLRGNEHPRRDNQTRQRE